MHFSISSRENFNCLSIKAHAATDMHIHNEGVTVGHKINAHAHSYTQWMNYNVVLLIF